MMNAWWEHMKTMDVGLLLNLSTWPHLTSFFLRPSGGQTNQQQWAIPWIVRLIDHFKLS